MRAPIMPTGRGRKTARIALTSGEPAGIGPDLCLAIAQRELDCELICLADRELLTQRARALGASIQLREYKVATSPATQPQGSVRAPGTELPDSARQIHTPGVLNVWHTPLAAPCIPGKLDVRNANYVLRLLNRAIDGCMAGEFDAVVTAPVQKSVIAEFGVPFMGHTEYLAERTHAPRPVMMLTTGALRVALATTHLPLKDVSAAITAESLSEVIEILDRDLKRSWGFREPRIAVCGLNPHAGESGYLGDEEIRVITPTIARMRERGIRVTGPLPADTLFVPRILSEYDAVLAMYHDQGLPVVKHAGFDNAVNVTLGLPIVRTSVDHGTALDLAATGRAEAGSLEAALKLAIEMTAARS